MRSEATPESKKAERKRRRRPLFAVMALGIGLFLSAVLGEVAARLLVPDTAVFSRADRWEAHPRLGRVLRPSQTYHAAGAEYAVNELRLRDRIYTPEPPEGVFRIAVIGDSFVFGVGEQATMFPKVLEQRLAARFDGRVEVMSVGMPGYGTSQQNDFLEEYLDAYRFDLVVLSFCVGNDIRENKRSVRWDREPESRSRVVERRSFWDSLLDRSRLVGVVRARRKAARKAGERKYFEFVHDRMELARPATYESERWAEAWTRTIHEIERMRAFSGAHGAAFEVFVLPDEYQVDEALRAEALQRYDEDASGLEPDLVQRRLAAALSELQIDVIDPLPEFDAVHTPGTLYIPFDTHFDEAGNALAARSIEEAVLARHGAAIERAIKRE